MCLAYRLAAPAGLSPAAVFCRDCCDARRDVAHQGYAAMQAASQPTRAALCRHSASRHRAHPPQRFESAIATCSPMPRKAGSIWFASVFYLAIRRVRVVAFPMDEKKAPRNAHSERVLCLRFGTPLSHVPVSRTGGIRRLAFVGQSLDALLLARSRPADAASSSPAQTVPTPRVGASSPSSRARSSLNSFSK